MDLGIIQGRLLKPVDGHIQEFPIDNWEKEFGDLKKVGLNHIEWIITNRSFNGGVLDLEIKQYSKSISSITCDNLISKLITKPTFLHSQLKPICDWAIKNNIKSISIPLLEDSRVTLENKDEIIFMFKCYGVVYPNLDFHFEMESDWELAVELSETLPNFYLIYDTGNITSCGFDHKLWIDNCLPYIKNVHLKDRTITPIETVKPFTGDTDFDSIFESLHLFGYMGKFTLQLAREEEGKELSTTIKHIKQFKELYNEKFI
tara:strand:- start:3857 stop:4636 length:780 start_codon:yes stop_codon:yes gene_type:complete